MARGRTINPESFKQIGIIFNMQPLQDTNEESVFDGMNESETVNYYFTHCL